MQSKLRDHSFLCFQISTLSLNLTVCEIMANFLEDGHVTRKQDSYVKRKRGGHVNRKQDRAWPGRLTEFITKVKRKSWMLAV